jgi:adenylosuccinate lyase
MPEIHAIGPLDGRYARYVKPLADFFGEKALARYRVAVECEYLAALSGLKGVKLRRLSYREKGVLARLSRITDDDFEILKRLELKGYKGIPATNHDVKAVEYFIKNKLKRTSLKDIREWVHFALTSWDVNNVAYALILRDALEQAILPSLEELLRTLTRLARRYRNAPMLGRTHGQAASPTTFGKECNVFAHRLSYQLNAFSRFTLLAKLNGASGNYNSFHAAYPRVDWIAFTKRFIARFNGKGKLKIAPNLVTTQIEPYDTFAELFDAMRRVNVILTDLSQDTWRYISDGWLKQKAVSGEVGSSTMPHKVNPIDFENAEGNLGLANALFTYFSAKLPVSRLQRDLSDSTVLRNVGVAFGHSVLAYASLKKGLEKIGVDEKRMREELRRHPEVIAEAIQVILRREGVAAPYELLRDLTRGRNVTEADLKKFIAKLPVRDEVKKELEKLTPENYTGLASQLATLGE